MDREMGLEAMTKNGKPFKCATPEHKADRKIVLEAAMPISLPHCHIALIPSCVQGLASPEDTGEGD